MNDNINNSEFPKRLKKLRLLHNKTQQEMAQALNITRGAYAQYERGKRYPDHEKLRILSSMFDVSIDYLLGNELYSPPRDKEMANRLWLRVDISDLTEDELKLIAEDLIDYFKIKKERLLKERKREKK